MALPLVGRSGAAITIEPHWALAIPPLGRREVTFPDTLRHADTGVYW